MSQCSLTRQNFASLQRRRKDTHWGSSIWTLMSHGTAFYFKHTLRMRTTSLSGWKAHYSTSSKSCLLFRKLFLNIKFGSGLFTSINRKLHHSHTIIHTCRCVFMLQHSGSKHTCICTYTAGQKLWVWVLLFPNFLEMTRTENWKMTKVCQNDES